VLANPFANTHPADACTDDKVISTNHC
jgi:hypothetical protein